jgi:nucleotide-binding universal stress UspA family protein
MVEIMLLALDDSEQATKAFDAAKSLAKFSGGEVRVLHVREYGFAGRAGQIDLEDRTEAHEIVDKAVDLTTAGIKASGTVRGALFEHGAGEILDEAASTGMAGKAKFRLEFWQRVSVFLFGAPWKTDKRGKA